MKTTKDEILKVSLDLFASRGFDAVSTADIAAALGITKGALYRHFESKQAIFQGLLKKMITLDHERAAEDGVPEETYEEDASSYDNVSLEDFCSFVCNQLVFWTEDPFAAPFRRMISIERYKSPEMEALYQQMLGSGPVDYTVDVFKVMAEEGKLKEEALSYGLWNLASLFFAPLHFMIQLSDGGMEKAALEVCLEKMTKEFVSKWGK